LGLFLLIGETPANAVDRFIPVAIASSLPSLDGEAASYSYVGSKKCKKCHVQQYKSWEQTKMANALDILKPGNSAEAKKKFNIDVDKDYTTDGACLKCHTVGYGQPGGYEVPDPSDKKAVRKAESLAGVGCESCHGPGSAYIEVFEEIMKSKRTYTQEELYAVGLTRIDESTCTICHNADSQTRDAGKPFDFAKQKDEGTHEHVEMKQRKK
jgi:hypothetical protein